MWAGEGGAGGPQHYEHRGQRGLQVLILVRGRPAPGLRLQARPSVGTGRPGRNGRPRRVHHGITLGPLLFALMLQSGLERVDAACGELKVPLALHGTACVVPGWCEHSRQAYTGRRRFPAAVRGRRWSPQHRARAANLQYSACHVLKCAMYDGDKVLMPPRLPSFCSSSSLAPSPRLARLQCQRSAVKQQHDRPNQYTLTKKFKQHPNRTTQRLPQHPCLPSQPRRPPRCLSGTHTIPPPPPHPTLLVMHRRRTPAKLTPHPPPHTRRRRLLLARRPAAASPIQTDSHPQPGTTRLRSHRSARPSRTSLRRCRQTGSSHGSAGPQGASGKCKSLKARGSRGQGKKKGKGGDGGSGPSQPAGCSRSSCSLCFTSLLYCNSRPCMAPPGALDSYLFTPSLLSCACALQLLCL